MSRSDLPDDQESLHLAKMLIEEHGPDAARYARGNADRLSKVQDCDGRDSWMRIAKAVDALLELQDADTVH